MVQSYTRMAALMAGSLERALRRVNYDHADVLLLGIWNKPVAPRILDAARQLRERGLTRFLAVSTHARMRVPSIAAAHDFDTPSVSSEEASSELVTSSGSSFHAG